MAGGTVQYIVSLVDQASAMAKQIASSFGTVQSSATRMGQAVNQAETALARVKPPPALAGVPGTFNSIASAASAATRAVETHTAKTRSMALAVNQWSKGGGVSGGDGLAGGFAGMMGLHAVRKAIKEFTEFEKLLVRLERVWPGGNKKEFGLARSELDALAGRLPLSREDIYKIATEATKSDVINERTPNKVKTLTDYVGLAAEFMSAFDLSSEKAATYLAKLKSSLGLSDAELRRLGDHMMWIEQKSAADPGEVLEVVKRNAALGMAIAGKKGVYDIAAIGGAQVAAGVRQDIAATGLRTMLIRLQQAAGMKLTEEDMAHLEQAGFSEKEIKNAQKGLSTARSALVKLGIDPERFSKMMTTDLFGAIDQVIKAIAKLPKEEQGAVLARLGGMRAADALKPLVANPALLDQARAIRDDPMGIGALSRAYAKNLETLDAHLTRLMNTLKMLRTQLVEAWKPTLKSIIDPLVGFNNFLKDSPLAQSALKWAAGLVALGSAFAILRFAGSMLAYGLAPLAPMFAGLGGAVAGAARITTWAYRFGGAAAVAALGLRMLRRAFIGFAIFEGIYQVIANWEKIVDFVERLREASRDPIKFNIEFPQIPEWLQWMLKNVFDQQRDLERLHAEGRAQAGLDADEADSAARRGIKPKSWWQEHAPGWLGGSSEAEQPKVQVEVAPIKVETPKSITINVTGPGINGTGTLPLSATHGRGATGAAEGSGPPVKE